MEEVTYSEKEIAIFNGLVNLMKEGANPYQIKVSDIAKAANIGKGTIYDYFDSKEEVISKAIIYSIREELRQMTQRIKAKDNFKARFYEVLNIIEDNCHRKISTLNLLLTSGGIEKFHESLKDKDYKIMFFIDLINKEILDLIDLGLREGIVKEGEDTGYPMMAIIGSVSSFSNYLNNKFIQKKINLDEAKDMAYKILIKALN